MPLIAERALLRINGARDFVVKWDPWTAVRQICRD